MNGEAHVRLCSDVLETGVYVNAEYPHCIDQERCIKAARCFWRGFHQLTADQYRRKMSKAQTDLFHDQPIKAQT